MGYGPFARSHFNQLSVCLFISLPSKQSAGNAALSVIIYFKGWRHKIILRVDQKSESWLISEMWTIQPKIPWNKFKWKGNSIRRWKFLEIQTGIFGAMESSLGDP